MDGLAISMVFIIILNAAATLCMGACNDIFKDTTVDTADPPPPAASNELSLTPPQTNQQLIRQWA